MGASASRAYGSAGSSWGIVLSSVAGPITGRSSRFALRISSAAGKVNMLAAAVLVSWERSGDVERAGRCGCGFGGPRLRAARRRGGGLVLRRVPPDDVESVVRAIDGRSAS